MFDPGDELQYHFRHDQLEALIARGEASRTPPAKVRPAYALTASPSARTPPATTSSAATDSTASCRSSSSGRPLSGASVAHEARDGAVYALESLEHREQATVIAFSAGQRVDGRVPEDVL